MKTRALKKLKFSKLVLVVVMAVFLIPNSVMAKKVIPLKHIANAPDCAITDDDPVFITKTDLLNSKGIYFSGQDTEFASAFRVISFTVSTKAGMYEESYNQENGPSFTRKQIDLIKRAKPRSKVYVENIIAIGPEGEKRNLGSITFKIKG
jgi:hypothetical protein